MPLKWTITGMNRTAGNSLPKTAGFNILPFLVLISAGFQRGKINWRPLLEIFHFVDQTASFNTP